MGEIYDEDILHENCRVEVQNLQNINMNEINNLNVLRNENIRLKEQLSSYKKNDNVQVSN